MPFAWLKEISAEPDRDPLNQDIMLTELTGRSGRPRFRADDRRPGRVRVRITGWLLPGNFSLEIREAIGSKAALRRHWVGHTHVNWRCPQTHYAWFGDPVEIVPNDLIPQNPPRQAIVKMHGSYQAIRPDQALSIVRRALPLDHSVIEWLSTNDFDRVRNRAVRSTPAPKGGNVRSSAPSAVEHFRRYMKEYEIVVSPLHSRLQGDFKAHLGRRRISPVQENLACVDLRYLDPERGLVLVEVKPTEPATVRFAIRTAMGQLLDYCQRTPGGPPLLIVIDDVPSQEEMQLALSNGFGISWREGQRFEMAWPDAKATEPTPRHVGRDASLNSRQFNEHL